MSGGGTQTQTNSFPEELKEPVYGQIKGNIAAANDIAGQAYQPFQTGVNSLAAPISGTWDQLSQEQRNQVAHGFGYGGEASGGRFASYLDQDPAKRAAFDQQMTAGSFTGLRQQQTGEPVAGLSPDQQIAIDRIRGNTWGQGSLMAAEETARRASTYVPGSTSAATMDAASIDRGDIRDVQARSLAGTDLNPYMNPYTQSVIDTTMADLGRQNDIVQNRTRARMAGAGAFGSQGTLAQTENDRAYLDTVARTSAGLNQANFAQAQQGAVGDITRDFQGQVQNQGMDWNTVNQNAAMRQQANAANAGFAQDTGQFNANLGLSGMGQQLGAANVLSGLGMQQQGYNLNNAQALLGAGTLAQGNEQQKLDAAYQEHLRRQQFPIEMLGVRQSALGGPLPTETTSRTRNSLGLGQVLGAAKGIGDIFKLFP